MRIDHLRFLFLTSQTSFNTAQETDLEKKRPDCFEHNSSKKRERTELIQNNKQNDCDSDAEKDAG